MYNLLWTSRFVHTVTHKVLYVNNPKLLKYIFSLSVRELVGAHKIWHLPFINCRHIVYRVIHSLHLFSNKHALFSVHCMPCLLKVMFFFVHCFQVFQINLQECSLVLTWILLYWSFPMTTLSIKYIKVGEVGRTTEHFRLFKTYETSLFTKFAWYPLVIDHTYHRKWQIIWSNLQLHNFIVDCHLISLLGRKL